MRDGGAWLAPAVDSILDQSLRALELLVVDDHSRDGAVRALDRSDARLRVLVNPGHGIVDALNAAAVAARAPLLARMDADDVALPRRLDIQRGYLARHPGVGIAGAEVEIFCEDGAPRGGYARYQRWLNALRTPRDIAREIFVESPIPHPSAMLRREVLKALGGYRHVPWSEDYDLWLRAHAAGVAMGKPRGTLLRWRDSPGRLSRSDPRCTAQRFNAARAHYLARGPLAGRPAILWGAGPVGAALHDALVAEGVTVTTFVDVDPRKIGGRKRGRPVHGPDWIAPPLDALLLGAVGAPGARERIRAYLLARGLREPRDFLFAA